MNLSKDSKTAIAIITATLAVAYFGLKDSTKTKENDSKHQQTAVQETQRFLNRNKDEKRVVRTNHVRRSKLREYEQLAENSATQVRYDTLEGRDVKISTLEDASKKMTLCEVEGEPPFGITYDKETGTYSVMRTLDGKIITNQIHEGTLQCGDGKTYSFNPKTGSLRISVRNEDENITTKQSITYSKIAAPDNENESNNIARIEASESFEKVEELDEDGKTFSKTVSLPKEETFYDKNDNELGSRVTKSDNNGISVIEEKDIDGNVTKRTEVGHATNPETGGSITYTEVRDAEGHIKRAESEYYTDSQTGGLGKQIRTSEDGVPTETYFLQENNPDPDNILAGNLELFAKEKYTSDNQGNTNVNTIIKNQDGSYTETNETIDINGNVRLQDSIQYTPNGDGTHRAVEKDSNGNIKDNYDVNENQLENQLKGKNTQTSNLNKDNNAKIPNALLAKIRSGGNSV